MVENLREGNILEEYLLVIIFGAVGVLESEPMLFFSLSSEDKEDRTLGEGFLKAEEGEILLKRVPCNAVSLESFSRMNLLSSSRTSSRKDIK